MAKKSNTDDALNFKSNEQVEEYIKLDKEFMNSHSAAEFNAYLEGAIWMMECKEKVILRLRERQKNNLDKIIEIENELSTYKELYEGYDVVYKKPRKKKKKDKLYEKVDNDSEDKVFQEDDYSDIYDEEQDDEEFDLFDELMDDEFED